MWPTIERKVLARERLTTAEGVYLCAAAPLLELGALAQQVRATKTDPAKAGSCLPPDPGRIAETRAWLQKAGKVLDVSRDVLEAIASRLPREARP